MTTAKIRIRLESVAEANMWSTVIKHSLASQGQPWLDPTASREEWMLPLLTPGHKDPPGTSVSHIKPDWDSTTGDRPVWLGCGTMRRNVWREKVNVMETWRQSQLCSSAVAVWRHWSQGWSMNYRLQLENTQTQQFWFLSSVIPNPKMRFFRVSVDEAKTPTPCSSDYDSVLHSLENSGGQVWRGHAGIWLKKRR